ncbi:hypothetical protein BHM03_00017853 [Ensete ventricosum]|nr:hypothetical protein BHM03_00017853 [Ensete ventricosum]
MEAGPAVAVPALTPVATSASLAATAYAVSSNTAVATTTSVATASAIATASAATKASSSAAASAILRFVDGDVPPVKVLAIHPLDGVPHRLLVPEGLLERAVVGGPGKTADETAELNIRSRHGKDRSRIVDRGGPGRESTRNPKSSPKSAFIDRAAGGCGNLLCRDNANMERPGDETHMRTLTFDVEGSSSFPPSMEANPSAPTSNRYWRLFNDLGFSPPMVNLGPPTVTAEAFLGLTHQV